MRPHWFYNNKYKSEITTKKKKKERKKKPGTNKNKSKNKKETKQQPQPNIPYLEPCNSSSFCLHRLPMVIIII
jgi:hypothetical protein